MEACERWLAYRDNRNDTAHNYGEEFAEDASAAGAHFIMRELEAQGFDSVWMPNVFGLDAMGALTVIGRETARIELERA